VLILSRHPDDADADALSASPPDDTSTSEEAPAGLSAWPVAQAHGIAALL
jgi:hypothetical protein